MFAVQGKYWRIGNKFYDLTPYLDKHPGGRELLLMARDRFDDSTYAFEAHHHNQVRLLCFFSLACWPARSTRGRTTTT